MARRSNTVRVGPGASACGVEVLLVTSSDNSATTNTRLLLIASPCALPCTQEVRPHSHFFRLGSLAPAGTQPCESQPTKRRRSDRGVPRDLAWSADPWPPTAADQSS